MSNNRFVLVPKGCGNGVTTVREKTKINDLKESQFRFEWSQVNKYVQNTGGCEAVIWYDDGSTDGAWKRVRNTPNGYHAEENLFIDLQATTLTVRAALITIEPCRGDRYVRKGKHNCYEFFMEGRIVDEQLRKFVPASLNTPVFYLEDQPRDGEISTASREFFRMDKSYAMEYLANLGGPEWGSAAMGMRKPRRWVVSGQELMTAEMIFHFLKKGCWPSVLTPEDWNPEGCSTDMQNAVKKLLSDWSSETSAQ